MHTPNATETTAVAIERAWLTVDEFWRDARRRGFPLGRSGAYEAIRRGEVPHVKVGRRIAVPRDALDRLLDTGGAE